MNKNIIYSMVRSMRESGLEIYRTGYGENILRVCDDNWNDRYVYIVPPVEGYAAWILKKDIVCDMVRANEKPYYLFVTNDGRIVHGNGEEILELETAIYSETKQEYAFPVAYECDDILVLPEDIGVNPDFFPYEEHISYYGDNEEEFEPMDAFDLVFYDSSDDFEPEIPTDKYSSSFVCHADGFGWRSRLFPDPEGFTDEDIFGNYDKSTEIVTRGVLDKKMKKLKKYIRKQIKKYA